mmetsp:Transcript_102419/g.313184  ORF Transcript_102419/g.313184 Transcript_102419/m.313184 type:complete len:211 (+) Transcript_102419:205-837(+)
MRFLGWQAISRPVSSRTSMQPGGHGDTATLGCSTWPPMPFSSAFLTKLTSWTFVYGLSCRYSSDSLSVLEEGLLLELRARDLERFFFDLLGLRFFRPSFCFSSDGFLSFSLCRLRLLSFSSAFSFLTLAFLDFFSFSRGSALILSFFTSRFVLTFDTSPSSSRSMHTMSVQTALPSCLTSDKSDAAADLPFVFLPGMPTSGAAASGRAPG